MEQINPDKALEIETKVIQCLETIYDPEIPVNIYELGLIYEVNVSPFADVHVRMTLTSPNCPVAGSLPGEVEAKISVIPEVKDAEVELTFDPPWGQEMMSEEARLELGFM
ncbi:MAG TPA: SUF system Fe-S cluster assembly protein [Bacteroidetes bacterium]|nr:SUF system Fe-S cluster assembly protein [Bacteroidota bacterium]